MFKKKKNHDRCDALAGIVFAINEREAYEKAMRIVKPKKKFNINEYPGKYVMYCENQEELFKFYDYLHEVDRKWFGGGSYKDFRPTVDGARTPIRYLYFNDGIFGSYNNTKHTVLNFKDFDWSDFDMKETKFKVGDKVRVKEGLSTTEAYNGLYFVEGMKEYAGKIGTITYIDSRVDHYKLDISMNEWWWNDAMFDELTSFTKPDLKTGMIVEHRDGERCMVIGDRLVSEDDCYKISDYNNDLKLSNLCLSDSDIVAVYNIKADELDDISDVFADVCLTTIWRREEVKEMTVAEIEKQLGYKVKIVDGE